jgi:hypothetical protein
MKRLILLLLALYSINCHIFECSADKNIANCSSHNVKELGDFNCHAFIYNRPNTSEEMCSIFPDSAEDQEVYWKISNGFAKEGLSFTSTFETSEFDESEFYENFIAIPEKEYYGKDEIVKVKTTSPSEEDWKIIRTKNTCTYKFMNQHFFVEDYKYVNLTDRNVCFNTLQFPDLANLINCGYATVTFKTDSGTPFTLKTCYFIPDNHLPDSFQKLFKTLYIDLQLENIIESISYEDDTLDYEDLLKQKKAYLKQIMKRKLQDTSDQEYEIIVEDKYGKKYKYTDKSMEPEVIEEGMQGDRIYGTNNNNHSQKTFLNYKLLLFMISLIFI